ncbi:hypothetical protein [Paenibacillus senegalensis]|uniref:hypothetical protein n=1 Tax=Paenibacillus senegalensis TaxID=1465766 RepID=UPI000287C26E|nr:hypothetical protein [Paenibacillus senegalensis]
MKKWILGFICGVMLIVLTAASPSNAIYGVLFPSEVTFYDGDTARSFDTAGGYQILNYNNKAYIPLRAFAEEMGATVNYEQPGQDGIHKIDIYQGKAPITWEPLRQGVDPFCQNTETIFISPSYEEWINDNENLNLGVSITNNLDEDIMVSSIDLIFQVRPRDSREVIYSRTLPSFSGIIPSNFSYEAKFAWDLIGNDGKRVAPGDYYFELVRPKHVQYETLESEEVKTVEISKGVGGCNLGYYGTTIY